MSFIQYNNVRITALACAVPSHTQEIDMSPSSDDAAYTKTFVKNVGIKRRHISVTGQTSLDLCHAAAEKALEKAGWTGDSIDMVIFVTQSPDYQTPGNGCILQYLLGMRLNTMAFDINLGCSAFPYGLYSAGSFLQSGNVNRVAVAFSDTQWADYRTTEDLLRDNSFVFGECGAVLLLEKTDYASPLKIGLWTDGSGFKYLHSLRGQRALAAGENNVIIPNGESVVLPKPGTTASYMDGVAIMSFATTTVVDSIKEFLEYIEEDINAYDGIVLHQANLQILKVMAKRLKLDMEWVPVSLDRYANTSAASVALTIADAYAGNKKTDLHLLASGFGIGLSWGVADLHISPSVIVPIFEYDGIFNEGRFKPI